MSSSHNTPTNGSPRTLQPAANPSRPPPIVLAGSGINKRRLSEDRVLLSPCARSRASSISEECSTPTPHGFAGDVVPPPPGSALLHTFQRLGVSSERSPSATLHDAKRLRTSFISREDSPCQSIDMELPHGFSLTPSLLGSRRASPPPGLGSPLVHEEPRYGEASSSTDPQQQQTGGSASSSLLNTVKDCDMASTECRRSPSDLERLSPVSQLLLASRPGHLHRHLATQGFASHETNSPLAGAAGSGGRPTPSNSRAPTAMGQESSSGVMGGHGEEYAAPVAASDPVAASHRGASPSYRSLAAASREVAMADDTTTASEVGGHGNTMEPPLPPPTIAATAPPSISRIMSAPCILERSLDQDAAAAVAALAAEEAQAAILSNRFVATTDDEDVEVDVEGAPTCGPPTMCRPPPVLVRPLAPPPPAILAAHPSGENAGAFTPVPTRRFMQRRGTQAGSSGLVAPEMVEEGLDAAVGGGSGGGVHHQAAAASSSHHYSSLGGSSRAHSLSGSWFGGSIGGSLPGSVPNSGTPSPVRVGQFMRSSAAPTAANGSTHEPSKLSSSCCSSVTTQHGGCGSSSATTLGTGTPSPSRLRTVAAIEQRERERAHAGTPSPEGRRVREERGPLPMGRFAN